VPNILFAWIGFTDLRASRKDPDAGLGPIAQAVGAIGFDKVILLSDLQKEYALGYVAWLRGQTGVNVELFEVSLSGPTQFGEIYKAAVDVILKETKIPGRDNLTFHLSPGTPAMAAVWIILGKTRFAATLIESSKEHGVREASVPFDISADFIPDLLLKADKELLAKSGGELPEAPEFSDIRTRCPAMKRILSMARRIAPRSIPVLIEGESGTGKELLARAIHKASLRRDGPLIAINCGAIPAEIIESELFGHERGAFTGAERMRRGHFESSHGGTLFLDEIGELPLSAQVKLLRVLQDGEIMRLGASRPIKTDVRIIAATNRNLIALIAEGRFREDLFYRLAVAVLKLPPLRDRQGDLSVLIDHLLTSINENNKKEPGYKDRELSASARNLLLQHRWPGNIRELYNTLLRAAIWSDSATIDEQDIRQSLLPAITSAPMPILDRPLAEGMQLPKIIGTVVRHYLERALQEAHGNKSRAAELVGLPSYQTFSNWMHKYGVRTANDAP